MLGRFGLLSQLGAVLLQERCVAIERVHGSILGLIGTEKGHPIASGVRD